MYRATPSNQLGKRHGARENSLPSPELWGKLRLARSLGSILSADTSWMCDLDFPLPWFPHVVSVLIKCGLTIEPDMWKVLHKSGITGNQT